MHRKPASDCAPGPRPKQHAEEVARIVGIGEKIEFDVMAGTRELVANVAQSGKVLDREAHSVEQGDFAFVPPARSLAGDHLPEFRHRVVGIELLDLALDAGLGRVFDENP
jgi:hypothetical protein